MLSVQFIHLICGSPCSHQLSIIRDCDTLPYKNIQSAIGCVTVKKPFGGDFCQDLLDQVQSFLHNKKNWVLYHGGEAETRLLAENHYWFGKLVSDLHPKPYRLVELGTLEPKEGKGAPSLLLSHRICCEPLGFVTRVPPRIYNTRLSHIHEF
jgi:hypothetical protein